MVSSKGTVNMTIQYEEPVEHLAACRSLCPSRKREEHVLRAKRAAFVNEVNKPRA